MLSRCCYLLEMKDHVQRYMEEGGGELPGHLVEYPVEVSQSGEVTTGTVTDTMENLYGIAPCWTLSVDCHCSLVDSLSPVPFYFVDS